MGNCMVPQGEMKKRQFVESRVPQFTTPDNAVNVEKALKMQMQNEERRRFERMSDEERVVERRRKREENERKKQKYNLEILRTTLNTDVETFLLNNILFSVQFFENFERDRSSFSSLRLLEQSRMNAEGPGGGLSSSRHRKRASLPDTMQETVGRWVRLDPPILNSSTFPAKNQEISRSRSYINLSSSSERLDIGKELLAPLRIMVVHEDVRAVEKEAEGELYRAVVPESAGKPGYLKLRCVGCWEEDQNSEIYNIASREKEVVAEVAISEEAEYSHYPEYVGSEKARESESEYSYSCKKLYDNTKKSKDEYAIEEHSSSLSSDHSEYEGLDTIDMTLSPGEKFLADMKKRKGPERISQRPPMLPPQDLSMNMASHEFGPQNPEQNEEAIPQRFAGRRDSGIGRSLNPWHTMYSAPRALNQSVKHGDASTSKEAENWKLGKTEKFGNIHKGFNHSPKPSISTENSDSDYGYATIPPSYTPQPPKRHGGIPQQCLTKVRYRYIEGQDEEEAEELDFEEEKLVRRLEGKGGSISHLFTTKAFINPSEFLTVFGEEVRWRENNDSSSNVTSNEESKATSEFLTLPDTEHSQTTKRQSRSYKNNSIGAISVDSGNGTEEDDDSLQARLGIPSNVPVVKKGASWYSYRDRCGMRFPIEIIPSITIPWPSDGTVEFRFRKRKTTVLDIRTDEKRPAWPGKLVHEASRTVCHAIVPSLQYSKSSDYLKNKNSANSQVPYLGWKLSFCEAERVLEEGLTHAQTRCLLFALLLRRCYLQWDSAGLSHNFVRTAFYWQCERGKINWPEEEMGNNLRSVLSAMYDALSKGKLSDYFMKKKDVASEEPRMTQRWAQATLHSMTDALSIHVARAISGLRFSDSRVPTLDFRRLVEILTDDSMWKTFNPALFSLTLSRNSDSEDEEVGKTEKNDTEPRTILQKEGKNIGQRKITSMIKPKNIKMPTIKAKLDENNTPPSNEMLTEFMRVGKRYVINPDEILPYPDQGKDIHEQQGTLRQKTPMVKVVKGTGTISSKKQSNRPELNDAFARLKKADKDKEWTAQCRKELEMAKHKKDETKDEQENPDIFAKAETYKAQEVSTNPEKRRLLLSLFAKHFAHLGRRCGRDWGAFRVADSYLRHAQNLAMLLEEHEGVVYDNDDDDEDNQGEAQTILNEIKKEFDILTTMRTTRFNRTAQNPERERNKQRNVIVQNSNLGVSMPDLSRLKSKGPISAGLGSMKSLIEKEKQNGNPGSENDIYSTDEEDEHL